MTVFRLHSSIDPRKGLLQTPSLWRRFVKWLNPPRKAEVLRFKNPTQWKLEKIRRKARGTI